MGATVATSSADSQLRMAPSPSPPASRSMPSRKAATRIGTGSGGTTPSLKPRTENVSYSSVTFSPVRAWRRKRTMSRVRWYGCSNGMPFQPSTMTLDDVPMPRATRPGAAWARDPTLCARQPGPRVNAGTMAVPRRNDGAHAEASASGVNASAPLASDDQTSV